MVVHCSELQRVVASCTVLQRVTTCCLVRCSVLQCFAVCRTVLQHVEYDDSTVATLDALLERTGMLQIFLTNVGSCLESESPRGIVSFAELRFSHKHELLVWPPICKWGKFVRL